GLLEVNHPGGVCWEGSTPNIIAGDVVEVVTKEDPNPALEEGDALESLDVTAKPAELDGLDIVVHGTARDDAGNPLPLDHLEQRIRNKALLATTLGKQELRATSAPGAHGTLAYDPVDPVTNPRGTNWT